jgi:hypothetical protein
VTEVEHPRHPPLDFGLFGLARWDGPKWVFFFEGEVGSPNWSVLLNHANDHQLIIVKTAPRQRWDRVMAWGDPGADVPAGIGEEQFAFGLVTPLLDMARPNRNAGPESTEDSAKYNRGLVAFANQQAAQWRSWDIASWTIGDGALAAYVFHFAHGWAGFSVDHPDYYIGVTAFHVADTSIGLAEVQGAAYDFDFSLPFGIQELQDQVGTVPDIERLIRASAVHPDHLLVMHTEPDPRSLPIPRTRHDL